MDALPAGSVVAGYEIRRVLGQGGFGIAYEAYNADLGERAAIKEFFPSGLGTRSGTTIVPAGSQRQLYQRLLDRFVDEARVVRSFDHPNVIKVRHLQRENNTAYIIMDFVEGSTLGDWARSNGQHLSAAAVRGMFEPVIGALEHVHARGKLHRDISPFNILVDRSGQPVIIDFGAVKTDWQNDARASTLLIAHPAYAPPERLDREIDQTQSPAIDIYSLGAVMYETIAGQKPPSAQVRQRELATRRRDPLPPLATVARVACPPEVTAAIDRSLSFVAEDRPQSMAELAALIGWRPVPDAVRTKGNVREAPVAEQAPKVATREQAPPAAQVPEATPVTAKPAVPAATNAVWDKIRSVERPRPNRLGLWITGLPEQSTMLSVAHGAGSYFAGAIVGVTLLLTLAPERTSPQLGLAAVVGCAIMLGALLLAWLARPGTGTALAAWLLLIAGLAIAPISIGLDTPGYWPLSVIVGGPLVAGAGYIAHHRRHDETALAMAVLALVLTLVLGLMPVMDRLVQLSPRVRLGVISGVVAIIALSLLAVRRPQVASPAFMTYLVMGALPAMLLAVLIAALP